MSGPPPSTKATRENATVAVASIVVLCRHEKQNGKDPRRFWMNLYFTANFCGERHNIINNLLGDFFFFLLPDQFGDNVPFMDFFTMSK